MSRKNFHYQFIKLLLACISCIVFAISIFVLRSCRYKKAAVKARITAEQAYKKAKKDNFSASPEIVLKETELYLFGKNNTKDCLVLAQESKMFPHNNETECTNVICKLTTNKIVVATLKAPKAYLNNNTKSMFLPGTVHGTFKEWSLTKQDVFYDATHHTIMASQTMLSSQIGISLFAPKSIVDLKNETVSLEGGVRSCFVR